MLAFYAIILCTSFIYALGKWIWPIMILGVEEVKKEYGARNLPIELQAATTEGYSMHIGTM